MAGRKSFHYLGGANRVNPTNNETQFDFDEAEIWKVIESDDIYQGKKLLKNKILRKNSYNKLDEENDWRKVYVASLPLKIPDWSKIFGDEHNKKINNLEEDDESEYERLPPHEYLARRKGSSFSFSVHEGIGRKLKGRDMSIVRNAVWKQIGFED